MYCQRKGSKAISNLLAALRLCAVLALAAAMAAAASIPIPGLCNTGVVGPCNGGPGLPLQKIGLADQNWELSLPAPTTSMPMAPPTGYPGALTFGPNTAWVNTPNSTWLANGPNSQWITPQNGANAGQFSGGYYFYQTTFTIPAPYSPPTAMISGMFTSDNEGIDIYVNGIPVHSGVVYPCPSCSPSFTGAGTFTLSAANATFISGVNTLGFEIRNRGGGGIDSSFTDTGLRVEFNAQLSTVSTPEPFVEVCKSSATVSPVTGDFTFTSPAFTSVPGNAITVPLGSCSGPIPVSAGTITITETPASGSNLVGVEASGYDPVTLQPENRLVSSNLAGGSAVITAVAGGVPFETVVTFTNQAFKGEVFTGQLKICKIAGAGVTVGTNFNFTATSTSAAVSQTYTVPAGPASEGGYCVLDNTTFPAGTTVKIVEPLPLPIPAVYYSVSSAVSPAGTTGGNSIVATLGTGITEVTFTNNKITLLPFPGDFNGGLSFSTTPSVPPAPQMFNLTSSPAVPFTVTASVGAGPAGWLTATPLQGTTPSTIAVSVAALPAGAYNGALAIASTDPNNPFSSTIPVTFIVAANDGFSFAGAMAQLAFGGGWNTTFTLVNTGTQSVQATLNFFDNNGNPLPAPLEFPQSSTTVGQPVTMATVTVNPGAGQVIETAGAASQDVQVGSAQLLANGTLSGFAVFQQTNGSRIQAAVAPLENRTPAGFVIWYDNTAGNATGIALANGVAQSASIPVVIRDDTGAILLSTTTTLAADGHTSFDLASTYAQTSGIRGTVEFDTPAGGQISVLGIEFSPAGAFTTIPALTK
jgi:hypothetical protein